MRDPRLIEFAKSMRREMTPPERNLWFELRGKRFEGTKFHRQHVIGRYIADFYSRKAALVIELDGDTYAIQQDYDRVRESYLNEMGLRVIRFVNRDVMQNFEGVLKVIGEALTPPLPGALRLSLSPEGERAL